MSTFTAIVHKEEDLYVTECPGVGTASQGETIEEAIKEAVGNLQEATELYRRKKGTENEKGKIEKGDGSIYYLRT